MHPTPTPHAGTLAGTGACDSLVRFKAIWDSKHRARGDILVYNTARPLESPTSASGFVDLVAEMRRKGKEGLATPDALIVAEGTEIYHFNSCSSDPVAGESIPTTPTATACCIVYAVVQFGVCCVSRTDGTSRLLLIMRRLVYC